MTGSSMCAEARPVRNPDNSPLSAATAPCMRRLISLMSCVASAMAISPERVLSIPTVRGLTHDRRPALAAQHRRNRSRLTDRENDDRRPVLASKREGSAVHDPQILLDCLLVAEALVTPGSGVFLRVRRINAVNIGGLEHRLAVELGRPQHRGGVGRKIGIAGSGG